MADGAAFPTSAAARYASQMDDKDHRDIPSDVPGPNRMPSSGSIVFFAVVVIVISIFIVLPQLHC